MPKHPVWGTGADDYQPFLHCDVLFESLLDSNEFRLALVHGVTGAAEEDCYIFDGFGVLWCLEYYFPKFFNVDLRFKAVNQLFILGLTDMGAMRRLNAFH